MNRAHLSSLSINKTRINFVSISSAPESVRPIKLRHALGETTEEGETFFQETEKFENLMSAGVIDPTKVGRLALENAASVAMMMLTTECVIAKSKEKDRNEVAALPQM